MASSKEKTPAVSKPVLYGSALLLVVGLAFYLNGNDVATPGVKKAAKKTAKKSGDSLFTDEDYKVHFDTLKTPVKNVFTPLVASYNPGGGIGIDAKSGIPTYLTGGEADWIFTGTAEDGNVTMALVENKSRGDSDFLKVGQIWKTSTVAGIQGDHLLLRGPDGEVKSILMDADLQDMIAQAQANRAVSPAGGTTTSATTVAPVTPPISGPIGAASLGDASAVDSNSLSVQPDTTRPRRNRRRGGNAS